MTAVSSNAVDALGLSVSQKTATKPGGDLGQDDFLLLMTTQLRNQDPTQPMDSGAFLGQLAQFSTVSGIQNMQGSFADLANSLYTNQALLGSELVGRKVLIPTTTLTLGAEGSVQGQLSAIAGPDVQLKIVNGQGQLVRILTPAAGENGLGFTWDGLDTQGKRLPPGTYAVEAVGASSAGTLPILLEQEVTSVSLGRAGDALRLNLTGGQSVDLTQVQQIR